MSQSAPTPDRYAAFAAWQEAATLYGHKHNERNAIAEQQAWNIYADACTDLGQCMEPNCRVESTAAYCDKHRDSE